MKVLVTGGAGYVGSHTVVALLEAGFDPIVVDNLSNSHEGVFNRIEKVTGHKVHFHKLDVRKTVELKQIIRDERIKSVIHFAALKSVEESLQAPLRYYENNIDSLFSVLDAIEAESSSGEVSLIFSSSATVYGLRCKSPISESADIGRDISNPYGWTKYFGEQILRDVAKSNPNFSCIALRYFNPIGAHPSGLMGESPAGKPTNVAPLLLQVALGKRARLEIFGTDYPTEDGTGVRDYVHVMDIAEGHVAAIRARLTGFNAINLGTGSGTSVKELVSAFESASGVVIPYKIRERRNGDIAECFADPKLAENLLSWKSSRTVLDACKDMWSWAQANPNGFPAN